MRGQRSINVRNGKYILDETNMRILDELNNDSRISMKELGKIIGLDRTNVSERIANMENIEIIEGYTVLINWDKIDNGESNGNNSFICSSGDGRNRIRDRCPCGCGANA